jgi:hypothetical protein
MPHAAAAPENNLCRHVPKHLQQCSSVGLAKNQLRLMLKEACCLQCAVLQTLTPSKLQSDHQVVLQPLTT